MNNYNFQFGKKVRQLSEIQTSQNNNLFQIMENPADVLVDYSTSSKSRKTHENEEPECTQKTIRQANRVTVPKIEIERLKTQQNDMD